MELRKAQASYKPLRNRSSESSPYSAFDTGGVGEVRVNASQMSAIQHLYYTNASIQAARSILMGQLLSSGLSLTRAGKQVQLTPTFERHVENAWLPFAKSVIDHLLMYGMVVVSIEEEDETPFAAFRGRTAKRSRTGEQIGDPQTKTVTNAADVASQAPSPPDAKNLVPVVPLLGTYEIALTPSGRAGYCRKARVYSTAPARVYAEDEYAQVFFATQPDQNGNVVSAMASAFEFASFIQALRELALSAELVRATPTLVTQSAPRVNNANSVDQTNLFFDSESRAMQNASNEEEASERTAQLALTARLAAELNRVRTTQTDPITGAPSAPPSNLPPEVPPRLFALPDKQQLVPGALQPQARTDLEGLVRLSNEAICCAFGVPASVVFEGKFSSNSMSQ